MTNEELIIYCAWTDNCIECRYTKECKMFTNANDNRRPDYAYPYLKTANKAWLESEVGEE